MAGLDPAIHRKEHLAEKMDARVKPAHGGTVSCEPSSGGERP
jgi:hypothetical protein